MFPPSKIDDQYHDVSTFEDRSVDFRNSTCRPSEIDGRYEIRLLYIVAQNIDTISVCELRREFALQCFHSIGNQPWNTMMLFKMRDSVTIPRYYPVCNVLRQWKTSLIRTYRVYRLYDRVTPSSPRIVNTCTFKPLERSI